MDFNNFKNRINEFLEDKINLSDIQKKRLKITGAIFAGLFIFVYAAFLILPYFLDLNKFMPVISDEVQKISGFKVAGENLKLRTTFRFGASLKADSFSVNYKDDKPLAVLKNPEIEINIPTILIGHINLDKIKAESLDCYLTFTKDKKYTVVEYIDTVLKNTQPDNSVKEAENTNGGFNFPIEIKNVNIKADKIALHLTDENVNKTYLTQLNNSSLLLKSLSGPLSIKTEGFSGIEDSDKKFATFNIDFKTKLPKIESEKEDGKAKEAENIEIPELNINPFKIVEDFNLDTDILVKLDIKDIEDFRANGDVNVNKFSLKLASIQLPESYLKVNFKDRNINVDSKIFASVDEFIQTKSSVKTGKHGKINLDVKTDKITIKSIKDIMGAVLDICLIENDMKNMTASGYIKGDFKLDTDFKTIQSNGEMRLIDGNVAYSKAGLVLSRMKAFLDFSENSLNIKDTSALVNGAKFSIKGEIASNADVNLSITSDPLKIKDLVNIGTQFKLVNKKDIADFDFKDGALTLAVNVLGDFKNIQPKADINLDNFKMIIKSLNMPFSIENINIVARPENKKGKADIDAKIGVKNIRADMEEPKLGFVAPEVKIKADMSTITIEPALGTLEGTRINVSGDVKNYMANPEMNIIIKGNVHPNTVLAFIPNEFRKGVKYQGQMPYNALVSGTLDNIKIEGKLETNPSNYISIVEIPSAKGKENILDLNLALKGETLDLNDISIKSGGGKLAAVKGGVKNIYAKEPVLSSINISLPNKTNIVIPVLGNMSLNAAGDITLLGKAFTPEISGNASIDTIKYPDFDLTVDSANLNFNKTTMNAKVDGIKVAKSDFRGDANISTDFSKGVTINTLNYVSDFIDTDALIALADKVMKTMPAPPSSSANAGNTPANQDLGVVINAGGGKIGKLKSGGMIIENINYDHTLLNNVYNLNNLNAVFAQGTASGKCSYNVMNGKITADMKADNIAMTEAAKAFIGFDIVRKGTLNGAAKVSLSGATLEEQLKTLTGTVTFEVKDGEYGENISFARFINAANVLNLGTFSSVLNTITQKVNSFNTQEFKNVSGLLSFNRGIAGVSNFKSSGPNMSLYATGSYNLLNNNANLKITGKVSPKVAGVLGNLGINKFQSTVENVTAAAENAINKAVDKLNEKYSDNKALQTGLAILGAVKNTQNGSQTGNDTTAETGSETQAPQTTGQKVTSLIKERVNPLFGSISADDISNVPALSDNTDNTGGKNFQVMLNGPVSSPKSIKSLKFQNDSSTVQE